MATNSSPNSAGDRDLLADLIASMPLPTLLMQTDGTIVCVSRSATPQQLPLDCAPGRNILDLLGRDGHRLRGRLARAARNTVPISVALPLGDSLRPFCLWSFGRRGAGDTGYLVLQAAPESDGLGERVAQRHRTRWLETSLQVSEQQRRKLESEAQRLEEAASRDPRTGLYNAMTFERMVTRTLGTPGAVGALLYIDLDDFKGINDRHGHLAGDKVLAEVARRLQDSARGSDLVGRLGGDEFGVWLHMSHSVFDAEVQDRLTQGIAAPISVRSTLQGGRARLRVGVSVGVARAPVDGTDFRTLLGVADGRMYFNKNAARIGERRRATD